MTTFIIVLSLLAAVGAWHLVEELAWQIHKVLHPGEVEAMIDYMEKHNNKKYRWQQQPSV